MANNLSLRAVFRDLAKHFRLPLIARGGEADQERTHFTPTEVRERPVTQIAQTELEQFRNLYGEIRKNKYHFFAQNELAKKVRLSTNYQHYCVVQATRLKPAPASSAAAPGWQGESSATQTSSKKKLSGRSQCVLCTAECHSHCVVCLAPLHIDRIDGNPSCFEIFHDSESELVEIFDHRKRKRKLHGG